MIAESHKLVNGINMWKGNGNSTTLLFSLNGLKEWRFYLRYNISEIIRIEFGRSEWSAVKNVIDLVVSSVSWPLPCVQLRFPYFESRIHHNQIVLLAEVDEHLASLISFTECKRSYHLICRSFSHYAVEVYHYYVIHLTSSFLMLYLTDIAVHFPISSSWSVVGIYTWNITISTGFALIFRNIKLSL